MIIKPINYGIACRIGNIIYYNKALKCYPELFKAILRHEKDHSNGFIWSDAKMDINNTHLKGLKRQYYSFILSHPKSLIEFFPFWVYDKKLVINPMLFLFWSLFTLLFGVLIWFG